MKESVYNVYLLDEKEKECLVFNTMHRSIVQVDEDVYTFIKDGRIDEIDDEVMTILMGGGIVVPDNMNEKDMLKIIFNRAKYDSKSIGFTIIPTHLCNLACKYCYQGHGDILSQTMDEKTLRKTIEFIKKNAAGRKSFGVNLYGGEPLLAVDTDFKMLEELQAFADEQGMRFSVTVTTNGTLFTEEIVKKFKDYNHQIQITLCGPKEYHDNIRVDKKGNGTYETLMNVLKLFKKYNMSFHIRVDVDKKNYTMIRSLLDDLTERGFGGTYLGFCPIGKEICYGQMELNTEEADPADLARLAKLAFDMGFRTNPIYISNFIEGCSALMDGYLAIDPKGDVYKCLAAPNYTEHRFGTINEVGNLIDMNYDAYCKWTLRDPLLIEECVDCKFSPICAGGCTLNAYSMHGDINTPGCEKKELGEIVRTYIMLRYPELFKGYSYETIVL